MNFWIVGCWNDCETSLWVIFRSWRWALPLAALTANMESALFRANHFFNTTCLMRVSSKVANLCSKSWWCLTRQRTHKTNEAVFRQSELDKATQLISLSQWIDRKDPGFLAHSGSCMVRGKILHALSTGQVTGHNPFGNTSEQWHCVEHATDNSLEHASENPRWFLRCRCLVRNLLPPSVCRLAEGWPAAALPSTSHPHSPTGGTRGADVSHTERLLEHGLEPRLDSCRPEKHKQQF